MAADAFGEKSAATVGLIATALGTLVALGTFPDNPAPQGALTWNATVLTVGILFVPVIRVIRRSPSMMNTENFVAFGFVYWVLFDLIQGAYSLGDATDASLEAALLAVGVSASAMWLGAIGSPWPLPGWLKGIAARPLDQDTVRRLIPVCFFLGMLNYLYAVGFNISEMFSYLGENRWAAPWGRGQLGGWGSFIDQMPYFGYVLPSLTALVIVKRGFFKFESLLSMGVTAIMLLFLSQGGGRRIIGVTVGAAIIVWVQAQPGMQVRKLVGSVVAVVALLWAMQFMLNIRTQGYQSFIEDGSEYDYLHVDDNFLRLAQTMQIIPAERSYVYSQQVVFALIRPVPRVFWPGKPIDPGFDLPSILGMKGVSLSSSIIGEWYITYGWLAMIFGGWLHGRLAVTANQLRDLGRSARNPIVFALSIMVLFSGMRSMQDLVIMSYAIIAWWGVNRLVARRAYGPA
ncbi:MAG TPA: O-antigen polymerase [Vicinamibacterales bacterium]|jgi:oligosaccharide repeat unit polymerase